MNLTRQSSISANLKLRAGIIQAVRRFFMDNDYLEVETPIRIPAPAPEAHIDAQPSGDWFLQTSPELAMKQLLSSGYTKIYQICKCFRQHERGQRHVPELTMLEWYCANATYLDLMDQCVSLVQQVAASIGFGTAIMYQSNSIDLTSPWDRMTVKQAFDAFSPISMETALAADRFDEIMGCDIEPRLGIKKPVFLYDYPASKAALSRLKPDNPDLAERFELYIGGIELCNAFTELTDPLEQRKRFEDELAFRKAAGKPSCPIPERFLTALATMPPSAGNALGLDRLVMIFADTPTIDDVLAFTPEELR